MKSAAVPLLVSLVNLVACEQSDESLVDRQIYCREIQLAHEKFELSSGGAIDALEAQGASERKLMAKGADATELDLERKKREQLRVCAEASYRVEGGLNYLVGVDRSSHIFFRLGKDERHANAGRVASELFDHQSKLFDARGFYQACSTRSLGEEMAEPETIRKTQRQTKKLLEPYFALCRELGAQ